APALFTDDVDEPVVTGDVIGSRLPGQVGLVGGRGGGDHDPTAQLHNLGEQQADPAGGRVHHDDVRAAHRIRARSEVVGGHALQHDGSCDRQVDPGGYGNHP